MMSHFMEDTVIEKKGTTVSYILYFVLLTKNKAPCLNFVKINSIYFDLILKRTKFDCSQLFLFFGQKLDL